LCLRVHWTKYEGDDRLQAMGLRSLKKGGFKVKRTNFSGLTALSVLLVFIILVSWVKLGGAADGKIVIGMIEPLSGPLKDQGDRFVLGARYTVDEINA